MLDYLPGALDSHICDERKPLRPGGRVDETCKSPVTGSVDQELVVGEDFGSGRIKGLWPVDGGIAVGKILSGGAGLGKRREAEQRQKTHDAHGRISASESTRSLSKSQTSAYTEAMMRIGVWLTAASALLSSSVAAGQMSGSIQLSVDLRDAPKKVLHATETIPVTPGAMVLAFSEVDSGRAWADRANR